MSSWSDIITMLALQSFISIVLLVSAKASHFSRVLSLPDEEELYSEKYLRLLSRDTRWTHPRQAHLHSLNISWPVKRIAQLPGDIILGGLMMVHEREDSMTCGQIMPQGGIQALECMLYTIDWINNQNDFLPGVTLGAYILDDCDKDTYGLEQAVDFIKGNSVYF